MGKIAKFFPDRTNIQLINRYWIISGKNKIAKEKYNSKDIVKKQQKEYCKEYYQKKKVERLAQQNPADIDNAPAVNPIVIQAEEMENDNANVNNNALVGQNMIAAPAPVVPAPNTATVAPNHNQIQINQNNSTMLEEESNIYSIWQETVEELSEYSFNFL